MAYGLGRGLGMRRHGSTALLDHNFSLMSSLPSALTFSRGSTATYINSAGLIALAAGGVARMGAYAPGGTMPGLLMEGSRTNLCTYSNDPSNAAWSKGNITLTSGFATGPDGTSSAWKVTATASAATVLSHTVATSGTTSVASSVYVKEGSGSTSANTFAIRNDTTGVTAVIGTLNYSTGVFTYSVGSSGVTVEYWGNGWWRVSIALSSGITSGDTIRIYAGFVGNAAVAGDYFLFYHGQLEAGTFPSFPIYTTSASATRNFDRCYLTLTAAQAATLSVGGTMVVEYTLVGGDSTQGSGSRLYGSIDDATSSNRVISYNASGASGIFVALAGATQAAVSKAGTIAENTKTTMAVTWAASSFNVAAGGASATRYTTTGAIPSVLYIGIGCQSNGGNVSYAIIHRITVYAHSTESDTALAALST